jgi:anti-anti-sigma factor
MTIQERAVGSAVILDISGRLVLNDGDGVLKEKVGMLLKQGSRQVVLNMTEVSYVDSAGLGALVGVSLAAKNQGAAVRLLNPSKRLKDLLSMARLLTVVEVCQSDEPLGQAQA